MSENECDEIKVWSECKNAEDRIARIKQQIEAYEAYLESDDADSRQAFSFAAHSAHEYLPWTLEQIASLRQQLAIATQRAEAAERSLDNLRGEREAERLTRINQTLRAQRAEAAHAVSQQLNDSLRAANAKLVEQGDKLASWVQRMWHLADKGHVYPCEIADCILCGWNKAASLSLSPAPAEATKGAIE